MTGIEIFLLLAGCVFMVGSFFITEKLSPSELNKIAELSQEQLKRIVDSEIQNAGPRREEKVDDQIDASSDLVQRALEKETNLKIMAISDYSDTVIENMNKTHNEIVFLYSMLNDKHTELTGMASDLQRLAADIRNMEETVVTAAKKAAMAAENKSDAAQSREAPKVQTVFEKTEPEISDAGLSESSEPSISDLSDTTDENIAGDSSAEQDNHNREILHLCKEGLTEVEIAKKLGLGIGEVKLVIGLYRGELDL